MPHFHYGNGEGIDSAEIAIIGYRRTVLDAIAEEQDENVYLPIEAELMALTPERIADGYVIHNGLFDTYTLAVVPTDYDTCTCE